uniref:Uncharacterized protein n=1 Tax=Gorilla gorilla gorilla TaxID=9595 RepID=A0A2I2Z7Q8_GORGO
MLCKISCYECSSYPYCTVYMCAACVNPSKFCFRFWSFHLKYSWSVVNSSFLCVLTNIPRQPRVSL